MKKTKDGDELPTPNQSVYVRTAQDALSFSQCGDSVHGGYRECIAKQWEKQDGNPSKRIPESKLAQEIKENGPVVADFVVRKVKKDTCLLAFFFFNF